MFSKTKTKLQTMRDLFYGYAQVPLGDFNKEFKYYIQPEGWGGKILFICWRVVMGRPSSPRHWPKKHSKFSRFLEAIAKPAGFWSLFFLLIGRRHISYAIILKRNKKGERDVRHYYSEALSGFCAGEYMSAYNAAECVLRRDPNHAGAAVVLARCAQNIGREYDAIDLFQKEIPSSYNIALAVILLVGVELYDEAIDVLMSHIEQNMEDAEVAADYLLLILNRRQEALKAYDIAFQYSKRESILFKKALALPLYINTTKEIALIRDELINSCLSLQEKSLNLNIKQYYDTYSRILLHGVNLDALYPIIYHCRSDVALTKARAGAFLANFPSLNYKSPHVLTKGKTKHNHKGSKINIGCFVDDIAIQLDLFWGSIFETLPRDSFHFTLFIPQGIKSEAIPRLQNRADNIVPYPFPAATYHVPVEKTYGAKALPETRSLIASCDLDIFYNIYIGQNLMAQFLAYSRLALCQISDGARLTTSGMPEIDYYLLHRGDFLAEPEQYFTEKLAVLSGITPVLLNLLQNKPQVEKVSRSLFNLPDKAVIYLCMGDLTRRYPDMDRILARLLLEDPKAMVVVTDYGLPGVFQDFLNNLKRYGVVDPERCVRKAPIFLGQYPKSYYYGFMGLADANLAYRGMVGGTVFYDHLLLGLPQIVWPFDHISNMTARLYQRMGLDELIVNSEDEYIKKIYRMAHDRKWKQQMTDLLANKTGPFVKAMKKENSMADLRCFFKAAVERAKSGLPPAHWHDGQFYEHLSAEHLRMFARIKD